MKFPRRVERFERVERIEQGERGKTGDVGPPGPVTVVHDEERERRRDRKALYRAAQLLALPVAIVAIVPSVYGLVRLGDEVERNCRVATENRNALRAIFIDAAERTATSKQRSAEEKKEAAEFYERSLKRLPKNPC